MAEFQSSNRVTKWFSNQQGMILMFTILVVIMVSMWGAASLTLSNNEYHKAILLKKTIQAHYLAEAGLEEALIGLKKDPLNFRDLSNVQMETGSFNVTKSGNIPGNVVLISVGKVEKLERSLKAEVLVKWDDSAGYVFNLTNIMK